MTRNHTANRHGSAVITLPSETEMLITRVFDAPAELIFRAWTTPELAKRWWGFETSEWLVCEIDLRVGGTWRFVARERDMVVGFHGEYLEIDRPHRLVSTEIYEGAPNPEESGSVNTMTLDEVDGVTTMTTLVQYPSQEIRDMVLETGMEDGMQVSYDRLEDLVGTLA
jgi:uncharacterized protein YndB with AHSA1/START domain